MKKRKDGRYEQKIYLGENDGKKQYKTIYGKNQKEVKQKIAELKLKQGKGVDISSADDLFGKWADRFVAEKGFEDLSLSHLDNLKNFRRKLGPLDDIPISKVTIYDIQMVVMELADWHEGIAPLSKRTLSGVKQVASQIFELAIASRVLDYNPAKYVKIPKNAAETHREALNEEQQKWIQETHHRAQLPAMIMLYSGLRRGEVTALTWGDINLAESTIHVSRSVEFIGGQPQIKQPKTKAGTRTVNIPKILADFLRKENKDCLYVVHTLQGKMLSKIAWQRLWASYMADLNVKYGYGGEATKFKPGGLPVLIKTFTPHQLRHTFASLLYFAGVDILTARDQLGHNNIQTTLGIYACVK